jgi:peptide/nickel transport system substrate-binding protein
MKHKIQLLISVLVIPALLLVACAAPAPEVVEKEVIVEKEVPVTVEVEKEVIVKEKVVETVIVEKEVVVEKVVTATPSAPKILRVRLYGDIQNMDPAFQISENDGVVFNAVTNGLVRYCSNSYELCNELAESIEQSEDGLEISFKLKEGVMWHEGYGEVTTEDVKYSYERMIDPELDAAYADDWATLDHVEIIDKYRGKIILKEPFAPLWTSTMPVSSGTIISKKYVEEIGYEAFATDIIGSGPYLFAEWRPQEKVILKKNPDYFGEEPYWDEIHLIPIEDDKSAEIALEAGDIDWARIAIPSVQRFEDNPNFEVWKKASLRYRWIAMNVEHPKLQDINVRKAIIHAIDVPSILQATYMGQVEQEFALVPPGLVGSWADAPRYERDVEKAKEFMAAAGLETLDLRLDLQDTSEYRTWAEIAQQNLKDIGINLELNTMESSAYWSTSFGEQACIDNELLTSNYSMQPDPAWATMWFTCDQVTVWNTQCWCSEEYDELHRKGLVTLDLEERANIYIEMQKLWDEAAQTICITHGVMTYAYSPNISPSTTPNGRPLYHFFGPGK